MQTRTVAAPLFASLIAGLMAFSGAATATATAPGGEECLAGPKGATPAGAHWRYRVDHATHRNCWYLKDEGAGAGRPDDARPQPGQDGEPAADASGAVAMPPSDVTLPPASAEAHAELTAPRARKLRPDVRPDAKPADKPESSSAAAGLVDAKPAARPEGSGASDAPRAAVLPVRVSDAAAATDGAALVAPTPAAAADAASPDAPSGNAGAASVLLADAPRNGAAAPSAASPGASASDDAGAGPLRMFLGLALIGAGLSLMLACLVFHLMSGTIAFAGRAEAGQLTDLL